MKRITVKDLQDQTGQSGNRPMLYCSECGGEYSANAGDYFMASPTHVFTCCGQPMQLVFKHTVFSAV